MTKGRFPITADPLAPPGLPAGPLWSLWDIMRAFDASGWLSLMRQITLWSVAGSDDLLLGEPFRADQHRSMKSYEHSFTTIGLSGSRVTLGKLIAALDNPDCTYGHLRPLCQELRGRLVDETRDKAFFQMTLRESDLFIEWRREWESSIERFPGIVGDVEESSKCLALSRYAAAIFHSLQIVEASLIDLGSFLLVTDPHSGWTAVSGALAKSVAKKWGEKTSFEKKNHVFLEQVQGTVEGLKNAWRNKISHVNGKLVLITKETSPQVAEEILFATRAFVRRLAEGLPPPKKPKKGGKK